MSTILKALERLEKEKQGGSPRPGSAGELSVVRPGVPQEPSRRWRWIAGGIGALALTGVLAVWLRPLVEPPGEASSGDESGLAPAAAPAPPVPAPAPTAAPAEPAPTPGATPAPPAPSPAIVLVPEAPAPTPGALPEPVAPPAQPPQAQDPLSQAAAPAPEPAPIDAPEPAPAPLAAVEPVAEAQPTLDGVDPVAPAPEPAPIDAPEPSPAVVEPAPAPPPAREVVRPRPTAPKPRPAPAVARAPVPKVVVERTIWHPEAARRRAWVRLEGRASTELREGDSLGGVAVRRIEPSGVVFVAEGRELRRAVGALP